MTAPYYVSRPYHARHRVRICTPDGKYPAPCCHEDDGSGGALCGIKPRSYRGMRLVLLQVGSGDVDCGNCMRVKAAT